MPKLTNIAYYVGINVILTAWISLYPFLSNRLLSFQADHGICSFGVNFVMKVSENNMRKANIGMATIETYNAIDVNFELQP